MVTRALNTDTIGFVQCPRCRAEKGEDCHSPLGRTLLSPHVERITAFMKTADYNKENYRVRALFGTELNALGPVVVKH